MKEYISVYLLERLRCFLKCDGHLSKFGYAEFRISLFCHNYVNCMHFYGLHQMIYTKSSSLPVGKKPELNLHYAK